MLIQAEFGCLSANPLVYKTGVYGGCSPPFSVKCGIILFKNSNGGLLLCVDPSINLNPTGSATVRETRRIEG